MVSSVAPVVSRTNRWQNAARIILAGPVSLLLSAMVFAGMPLWLPRGEAGIDHIVLPLILLPAVWATLFFYAVLDRSLVRVAIVSLVVAGTHGVMLAQHFAAPPATVTSKEAR